MSDFHYVRTLGTDGGVDVCSGPAIGLDLASVLADGLPPFNVALQIIAGVCEILDIAEEDGEVHGDLDLEHVFVDDTGAVSLEAFHQPRTRAPEGKPKGHPTDLYGLGVVTYRLLAGRPLPPLPVDDADAHDDAVIDAVLAVDLGKLNETMVGDVQWFLAKLLSFDREDRPSAVECWRTFVAFAGEVRGPDFVQWCLDALDGGGERRTPGKDPDTAPEVTLEEDLDGPMMSRGPLGGGLSFETSAAAGGTAFFTKAEMKAALETDAAVQAFKPAAGGGSATSYWTKDQLKAMSAGGNEAPRPKRATGEGERRKTMATSRSAVKEAQRAQEREATPPAAPARPAPASRAPATGPTPKPPRSETSPIPAAPPPRAPAPGPSVPQAPPPPPPFSGELGGASEPFEHAEPTIRMKSPAVRTTRTPAPAPQVHRPPRVPSRAPEPAPFVPPPSASGPAQEETVIQKVPDLSGYDPGSATPAWDPPVANERSGAGGRQLPIEPPVPTYSPPTHVEEEGGGSALLMIAGIVLVLVICVVACMGLGGVAGVVALLSGNSVDQVDTPTPRPVAPTLPVGPSPDPEPDPGPVATGPKPSPDAPSPARPDPAPAGPTPRPTPQPAGPTPRPTPQPAGPTPQPAGPTPRPNPQPAGPSPTPRPTPTPRPQPTPTPPPVPVDPDQPITLTLKSSGRGKLKCPGFGDKSFDGNTSMNIEPYQLPATCVVEIDKKMAAFQVFATGTITCNLAGSAVECDRTAVR